MTSGSVEPFASVTDWPVPNGLTDVPAVGAAPTRASVSVVPEAKVFVPP